MKKDSKIYVAGHKGMVGSSIVRVLKNAGYDNIIMRTHEELDLCNQIEVEKFFEKEKPEYVFLAAARVGGILANQKFKSEFIYENVMIEMNIIHSAWKKGCKKLLFLGSSCIYPSKIEQPIREEYLLKSELEKTNEAYALAKIIGVKYCEFLNEQYNVDFISVMPTNIYGVGDNYDLQHSHFLPALIRKIHEAKKNNSDEVICWGTGEPLRDYMYVDDLAEACLFLMNNYFDSIPINVGTGKDMTIRNIANTVAKVLEFKGEIKWDKSKPDGMKRKLLDISKLYGMGWKCTTKLEDGIMRAYQDFLKTYI